MITSCSYSFHYFVKTFFCQTFRSNVTLILCYKTHNLYVLKFMLTVEPMYYGHLRTNKKCPDYQGVLIFQVILCNLGPQLSVWISRCHIFKCSINRFHCILIHVSVYQAFCVLQCLMGVTTTEMQ